MVRWSEEDARAYEAKKAKRSAPPPAKRQARIRGAEKTIVDGIRFDSKREATRWTELRLEQRAGAIANLERQVRFALVVNHTLICEYVADFVYDVIVAPGREEARERVVEDAKGFKTEMYRIKKKLMKACYGIEILET